MADVAVVESGGGAAEVGRGMPAARLADSRRRCRSAAFLNYAARGSICSPGSLWGPWFLGSGGTPGDKGPGFLGSRGRPESLGLLFLLLDDLHAHCRLWLPTSGSPRRPGSRCAVHVASVVVAAVVFPLCSLVGWLAWLRFLRQVARDHGPEAAGQLAARAGAGFRAAFRSGPWWSRGRTVAGDDGRHPLP